MIIVVNTSTQNTVNNGFIVDCFIQLAQLKPTQQFIFLVQDKNTILHTLPNNCSTYILGKQPKAVLFWAYWYNIKIPRILKKLNATSYINTDAIVSLKTNLPQFLFLNNIEVDDPTKLFTDKVTAYCKKNIEANLLKAKKIIVISKAAKEKICGTFPSIQPLVCELSVSANANFVPYPWQHQQEIKNRVTKGNDYFLVNATFIHEEDFIILLKAFTQFKKWQKSNLNLLIVSTTNNLTTKLTQQLSNYKYKEDVQLLTNISVDEYAKVLSAAYCFFFPYCTTNFPVQILEAMQCDVPVVTNKNNGVQAIFNDSVGYATSVDITAYADKMILLYKDENYRNQLIKKGVEFSIIYTIEKTVEELERMVY